MLEKLKTYFVPALTHALLSILYLFAIPLDLWVKAIERLAKQKDNGSLRISSINSPWPFLSFLKTLLLEFLFDLFIFLSYPIGLIIALTQLGDNFEVFLGFLVGVYCLPVVFSIYRDLFALLILPFRKFISWCRKPAQYFDLNVQKKEIV